MAPESPRRTPGRWRQGACALALSGVFACPSSLHASLGQGLLFSVSPSVPYTASGTQWALNKYPLNLMHLNSTNIY